MVTCPRPQFRCVGTSVFQDGGFINSARVFCQPMFSVCRGSPSGGWVRRRCQVDVVFPVPKASEFSSPVGDHGKHFRSELVHSRSSCRLGFLVLVGVSSSDPTRQRVTVLVVLSVDLIGVACSRAHPWCSSVQHRIQSRCARPAA